MLWAIMAGRTWQRLRPSLSHFDRECHGFSTWCWAARSTAQGQWHVWELECTLISEARGHPCVIYRYSKSWKDMPLLCHPQNPDPPCDQLRPGKDSGTDQGWCVSFPANPSAVQESQRRSARLFWTPHSARACQSPPYRAGFESREIWPVSRILCRCRWPRMSALPALWKDMW